MLEQAIRLTYTKAQFHCLFDNPDAKFKVIPKGRRFGITRAATHAFIEWAIDNISPLLWVDTINGNIDRYFERYFIPALRQLPLSDWNWNTQKKILNIYDSIIDFRSADSPQSIEGFGYKKIFLNEAGIILKDDYLYSHAILPMLIDYKESQLIAAGVPKGKYKRDGGKHKFYELWENVEKGAAGYWGERFSSYDNPLLSKADIDQIAVELDDTAQRQEIYAEFLDAEATNPFAHAYDSSIHESTLAVQDKSKKLFISIDFNMNPFAVSFEHIWRDGSGDHNHVFNEKAISAGSINKMIDYIGGTYKDYLNTCSLTGDAWGAKGQMSDDNLRSFFRQMQDGLGLHPTQIVSKGNPTHEVSRSDVNYFLSYFPDFKVNPVTCPETARDFKRVQCDIYGHIIKSNRNDVSQRADFLDCRRYSINSWHKLWIEQRRRQRVR